MGVVSARGGLERSSVDRDLGTDVVEGGVPLSSWEMKEGFCTQDHVASISSIVIAVGVKPTPFSSGIDEAVEEEVVIMGPGTSLVVVLGKEDEPTRLMDRRCVSEMMVGIVSMRMDSLHVEDMSARRKRATQMGQMKVQREGGEVWTCFLDYQGVVVFASARGPSDYLSTVPT